ncbi:MAG: hypothetical protein QHC90_14475, partial [Shinella sp.]|nr:hypothetical protein [Shinella sp.]
LTYSKTASSGSSAALQTSTSGGGHDFLQSEKVIGKARMQAFPEAAGEALGISLRFSGIS